MNRIFFCTQFYLSLAKFQQWVCAVLRAAYTLNRLRWISSFHFEKFSRLSSTLESDDKWLLEWLKSNTVDNVRMLDWNTKKTVENKNIMLAAKSNGKHFEKCLQGKKYFVTYGRIDGHFIERRTVYSCTILKSKVNTDWFTIRCAIQRDVTSKAPKQCTRPWLCSCTMLDVKAHLLNCVFLILFRPSAVLV